MENVNFQLIGLTTSKIHLKLLRDFGAKTYIKVGGILKGNIRPTILKQIRENIILEMSNEKH